MAGLTTAYAQTLDDMVVSANRSEQASFDAPGSIQAVGRDVIERAGPQINISEALSGVSGINVANRNNYAQDLQISIRGFGSRAPFGVRGVWLLVDGLPQTLPDGQGQSSQFALTSADRIEVLKGPISMLYGNAAGGVVQVFTRAASEKPELSFALYGGSDGLWRSSTQYSETRGAYGLVLDYATFKSEGFRDYSHAERKHINAKLAHQSEHGKTTFVANLLANNTEEPGSLGKDAYQLDRQQPAPGARSNQLGKEFLQGTVGVLAQQKLRDGKSLETRAYFGKRDLDNPLPGSFAMIDRTFYGGSVSVSGKSIYADIPISYTVGLEVDHVSDRRKAEGNQAGRPDGRLSRKEENVARNADLYAQTEWFFNERSTGLLGFRATRVLLGVKDRFLDDLLNGSGERTYTGLSPVIGLTRHVSPALNLFAQYGRGFETPTLNEVLYTNEGLASTNKFYGLLRPARSDQFELGLKWRPDADLKLDVSIFHANTKNDIVPDYLSNSGSTWQNADTQRHGYELSLLQVVSPQWALRGAYTQIWARYSQSGSGSISKIASGAAMPGIPRSKLFADLSWRSVGWAVKPGVGQSYSELGVEVHAVGSQYVDSANTAKTSPYALLHLRAAHHVRSGPNLMSFFIRLDNALDKSYVGSVVVDRADQRFYEPGAPRSWLLGLKYTRQM